MPAMCKVITCAPPGNNLYTVLMALQKAGTDFCRRVDGSGDQPAIYDAGDRQPNQEDKEV